MLREKLNDTDFSVLGRMLDGIEQGDLEVLRRCFAPGALVWHNDDETEQDVDQVIASIRGLCDLSTSRSYRDRRTATVGAQAFIQHTLTATLNSGRQLRMPAMMRVLVDADGLIERLEEYLDSRAVDCLAEEVSE
jgi:hypothetical protein